MVREALSQYVVDAEARAAAAGEKAAAAADARKKSRRLAQGQDLCDEADGGATLLTYPELPPTRRCPLCGDLAARCDCKARAEEAARADEAEMAENVSEELEL